MLGTTQPVLGKGGAAVARFLRRFFLVLFIILISTGAWAAFIKGQVFYQDGRMADHIVVRLRSDKITYMDEQTTDPMGKFDFDGLTPSIYVLTIEGQGFKPYSALIDLSMSKMWNDRITLQPDRPHDAKTVPPEGANATLNAQEAEVPAAARKEYEAGQKSVNEKHDADGGIKHYRKAIQLYGKYSDAYLALGLLYLDLQKFEDAQGALQTANEINPNAPGGYMALGTMYNLQKKYDDAEKALTRGLQLNPDVPLGQYELSKTYWAMGKWQDAEPHAQKAAELSPTMAPVHVLLGNIALRKQDTLGALKEFKEYLRLDPNGPMAVGVTQMIQKIEASQKK
jgi:tetratricopeptide (TPR) repeat protein